MQYVIFFVTSYLKIFTFLYERGNYWIILDMELY